MQSLFFRNVKIQVLFAILVLSPYIVHAREVVLLTGAARGIGASIANRLAASGDYMVYAGVRTMSNTELCNSPNLRMLVLDVTSDEQVKDAVATIIAAEGRVDALINNAGLGLYGSVESNSIPQAKALFDVNYFGAMRITQEVLPWMRKQEKGRIIQIGSRCGFRPIPSLTVYCASKAALLNTSEGMAATLSPFGVLVSIVEPGPVNTKFDFQATSGDRFQPEQDPYHAMFKAADLLAPPPGQALGSGAQEPEEIAAIVEEVLRTQNPHLRYQTSQRIRDLAAMRAVDPTGDKNVAEIKEILETGL